MGSYEDLKRRARELRDGGNTAAVEVSSNGYQERERLAPESALDTTYGMTSTRYADLKEKARNQYYTAIDNQYIENFYKDFNAFKSDAVRMQNTANYQTSRRQGVYDPIYKQSTDLSYRAKRLKAYLDKNREQLGDEAYNSGINDLKNISDFQRSATTTLRSLQDYYSQWETEEAYNNYINSDEYKWMNAYSGKDYKEIRSIMEEKDSSSSEYKWLKEYAKSVMSAEDIDSELNNLRSIVDEYNSVVEDLENVSTGYLSRKDLKDYSHKIYPLLTRKEEIEREYGDIDKLREKAGVGTTAGFGIQLGDTWYGVGDSKYDFINDIEGERSKVLKGIYAPEKINAYYKYTFMTQDEVNNYNYLYNTEGKDEAEKYLDYLSYDLDERRIKDLAMKTGQMAHEHPALSNLISIPTGFVSGIGILGAWKDKIYNEVAEMVTGEYQGPINFNSTNMDASVASSTIRGTIGQDLNNDLGTIQFDETEHPILSRLFNGKGIGDLYQVSMSMVDSSVNHALAAATGGSTELLGLALLGGRAATSGMLDAVERGATDEQALALGTLEGAAEMVFEKVSLDKLLKGNTKSIVKNILEQAVTEGSEEVATSLANNLSDIIIMAENSDYKQRAKDYMAKNPGMSEEEAETNAFWDIAIDIGWDFIGGALSGGVMGGGSHLVNSKLQYAKAKKVYGSDIENIVNKTLEMDPHNELAQKVKATLDADKSASGKQIYNLVQQNQDMVMNLDRDAIYEATLDRLKSLGETENVRGVAASLTKQVMGEKLTKEEQRLIGNSTYGQRVANELNVENINSGMYSSDWNQNLGTRIVHPEEYNRGLYDRLMDLAYEKIQAERNGAGADSQKMNVSQYEASDNGQPSLKSSGEDISIKEISSIKDSKISFELEDGRVVSADDVVYGSEADAIIYQTIADMNVNASAANVLMQGYELGNKILPQVYAKGINEAYRYGMYNYPMQEIANGPFASMLTEHQRNMAYHLGKFFGGQEVARAEAKIRNAVKKQKKTGKNAEGKVHYGEIKKENLTKLQKASIDALEQIAKALGVDIYLFESEVDADGHRIGSNGWYDLENNSIHIDIHAGQTGAGTILFTAAHELTHFIKEWAPAKFKVLANFLMREYGNRNISVETLVQNQIAKAKRANRDISYDTAYEEVIADSMEAMLADGKIVEKLSRLRAEDRGLWQKIKDYISELAAKIKNVYKGLRPDSAEGRYVAEMTDAFDVLQKAFEESLIEAGENYRAADGQNLHDKNVKMQIREIGGEKIVWIENSVLTNRQMKSPKEVAKYIVTHIGEVYNVVEGGERVYLGKDLPDEYTRSKYTSYLQKKNTALLKAKNKAVAELGEMIEIATNRRWEATRHKASKDAKYGIYRYDTKFAFPIKNQSGGVIDVKAYDANLLIRNASNGKKYLYDIVNVKENTANALNLRHKEARKGSYQAATQSSVSNNTILQKAQTVKQKNQEDQSLTEHSIQGDDLEVSEKSSLRDTEYLEAVKSDDIVTAQELVDEAARNAGYTVKAYHGTARTDRVGTVFRPDRATSGPMAFFTDNRDIASNYARDKADTSLAYDDEYDSYYTQFRVNRNGKSISVPELWQYLSFAERDRIKEQAKHIKFDDDVENILIDSKEEHGNGAWDAYTLNMHKGNALEALVDTWLESGDLYNREADFLEVLKHVGIEAEYRDPDVRHEKVYDTWLKIQKPFDTDNANQSFYDDLSEWIESNDMSVYEKESSNADMWDKNSQTTAGWLDKLADDIEQGRTHAWTSIPDFVTAYLKEQGYDGIKDKGGKMGGESHIVWIPFYSEQVKSAEAVTYDDSGNVIPLSERFNEKNADIRFSIREDSDRYTYNALISKPDMNITVLNTNHIPISRTDVVALAKKNAAEIGRVEDQGNVFIYVNDIDSEVMLSNKGLRHGLDRRFEINAPITIKAGEIIQNAIQINELIPSKSTIDTSYVLIGAAKNIKNEPYIVQFVVNRATNEVTSVDVLYSINAKTNGIQAIKKESTGSLSPEITNSFATLTDSKISISNLLDYVNQYFPDILPEDVLKHYGHTERPNGKLGQSALYSDRDPLLEKVNASLEKENKKLQEDVDYLKELVKIQKSITGGTKFTKSSVEAAASHMLNVANAKGSKAELAKLLNPFYEHLASAANLTWEEISEQSQPVVDWLYENKMQQKQLGKDMDLEPVFERDMTEQDLRNEVYDSFWRVSTLRTVADVKQKQIDALKGKHMMEMDKLRKQHKESLSNLTTEYKNAIKAVKKEYRKNAEAKQKEIIEHYQEARKRNVEGRQRTQLRHKIASVVKELNDLLIKETKDKHVPIELQKAVAEALDAVNMDTVGAKNRIAKLKDDLMKAKTPEKAQEIAQTIERVKQMGDRMGERIRSLKDAYAKIVNSSDPLIANSYDAIITDKMESVMENVGDTPLRDMTKEQLEDVYDLYKMVRETVRNANKAFKMNKAAGIREMGEAVMQELESEGEHKQYRTRTSQSMSAFSWNNLKPIYAFERIGSQTLTELYENVRIGEDTWAVDMTQAKKFYDEQYKKYKYDSWDFDKRYDFKSADGKEFNLSLDQMMSLYAYSKRNQAIDHLQKGGIVFDEGTEVGIKNKLGVKVKFNPQQAVSYKLSDSILQEIIGKMSKDQKAFVDTMQEYLSNTMGEKGNEISLAMYGIKLFKEKFYFPLKSAKQYLVKAREQQQGEVRIKNKGFTKEVKPNANNPVVLTPFMDVWADHVNEMSMYHAFTLPLEDFYRVYNYESRSEKGELTGSVDASIQNAHGRAATAYINQLLKDLNGGAISDSRESTAKSLIGKFKKAAVFTSLSVVIQQPSAVGRAWSVIGLKYFRPTVDKMNHKQLWEELKKYAPVAVIKEMGYFDTGMGRNARDFIKDQGYEGILNKLKGFVKDGNYRDEVLSKLPGLADEVTWCAIWNATKRQVFHEHNNMNPRSEEFLKLAGEKFTEVITKTQVYDSVLSRSANMRYKSVFMNMLTAFMAEPTTSINMLEEAARQFKKGNKRAAAKMVGSVFASVFLNSILVSLVYAARDDDEDETFLEKYVSSFVSEMLEGVNPITYYPVLKDIWSIAQGYDVERTDMSLITKMIESLQDCTKVISKDTSDMDEEEIEEHGKQLEKAMWDAIDHLSSLLGIPVKNIRREIMAVRSLTSTIEKDADGRKTTWGSLMDKISQTVKDATPIYGWLPDEKKTDKLYTAIISGDVAYAERLKEAYETEQSLNMALRKALRANDPRIKEAAKARMTGDIQSYTTIAKEIIAEGFFNQDLVVTAINNEITSLSSSGTATSSSKVAGFYKIDDFGSAIVKQNATLAGTIKADIVKTAQANGKTEEEAYKSFVSSAKSTIKEQFEAGTISKVNAVKALVDYCDIEQGEAELQIEVYSWQRDIPECDTITVTAIKDYNDYCSAAGITKKQYYDAWRYYQDTSGDYDENGDSIPYSRVNKVMPYIANLPLTSEQKTILAMCWWSEATVYKYKLW